MGYVSKITAGIRGKQGKANQSKKGANRGIGLTEWFWGWRPGGGAVRYLAWEQCTCTCMVGHLTEEEGCTTLYQYCAYITVVGRVDARTTVVAVEAGGGGGG